jgi:hypothetical protein
MSKFSNQLVLRKVFTGVGAKSVIFVFVACDGFNEYLVRLCSRPAVHFDFRNFMHHLFVVHLSNSYLRILSFSLSGKSSGV